MLSWKLFSPPACGISIVMSASKNARDTGTIVGSGTGGGVTRFPPRFTGGNNFWNVTWNVVRNPNESAPRALAIALAIGHRHLPQHFRPVRSGARQICLSDPDPGKQKTQRADRQG